VTLGVGVFCGLWPLVLLRTRQLAAVVREGDTRTASGAGRRLGDGLVVAEIAVACALLVGAGLLVKNLLLLQARETGMRTEGIVAFDVAPSGPRYRAPEQLTAFYRDLYARLAQIDLVERGGLTSHLPMFSFGWNSYFQIEGGAPWGPNDAPLVENRWFYGDYFGTLGVPLLKGRMLDERDRQGTRTVLINQAMADKFWPGKDPIGKRFGQGSDTARWYEVVGVIGSIRSFSLDRSAPYEFYRSIEQQGFGGMTVVLRARTEDPTSIMPTVRQIVSSIDPAVPVTRVQTLEQVVADSVGQPRLLSALTGLFASLAGLLAMVGVYGVMAYNVRRQRREFGIRLALGAGQRTVRALVVGRGLVLGCVGVAIGAFGAWLLTGVLRTMLHDVRPTDPSVFAGVALAVLVVTTLASYLPARAAGRVDPMVVLREE
jgi:putative ABC transport system permease protein